MSIFSRIFKKAQQLRTGAGFVTGQRNNPPVRGTQQILEAYSDLPWLRATTNKISRSVADTNWRVYALRRNGKAFKDIRVQKSKGFQRQKLLKSYREKGELEEITAHPLLDLLYGGNDLILGVNNIQLYQIYMDLVGEAFFFKERDGLGVVIKLWPIPPHWIKDTPTLGKENFKLSYAGIHADIPIHDMLWIIDPNPAKPYERGTGGARALADELETDEYSAKYTKAWFYNSARPDLIISGDNLSETNTKLLEQSWLQKHQGILKQFKPFFISKSVEIKELSQSFQNMQLIELRKFERDSIHQFWGIPPEILGIIDKSNRATIDGADFIYAKHVITPRVELLRTLLQERLIPDFDDRIILDFDSTIEEDKEHKLNVYKSAPHMFTQRQWQELAGEQSGDDIYAIPFNITFTDSLNGGMDNTNDIEEKANIKLITKQDETQLTAAEISFIESVVASIKFTSINSRVEPVFTEATIAFGEAQADLIGINYFPDDPQTSVYINERVGTKITGITENTRNAVRKTLGEGILAGESMSDLEGRIRDYFRQSRRGRARTIARTETVAAANYGALTGMRQGSIDKKMWLSSRDERVRDTHKPETGMDGQIVGVNDNFISPSGATGPFPGDMSTAAETINCRCTIISVINNRSFDEAFKKDYWKSFESERMPYEKNLINLVRDAFTEQELDALKTLNEGKP